MSMEYAGAPIGYANPADFPNVAVDAQDTSGAAEIGAVGFLGLGSLKAILPATAFGGIAIAGIASAAAGVVVAKAFRDATHDAFVRRLMQIRRHGSHVAMIPGLDVVAASRQLLSSLDWALSAEENNGTGTASLAIIIGRGGGNSLLKPKDRELKRHLRKIWSQCAQQPPRERRRLSPSTRRETSINSTWSGRRSSHSDANADGHRKLFNPGDGNVYWLESLCAALCFVLGNFLEHRHTAPGILRDAERTSLRHAVSALARHPLWDQESIRTESNGTHLMPSDFRRGAVTLLCFLDAALSWRPVDPFGWLGICEDMGGALLAKPDFEPCGLSKFAAHATHLRASLKKAVAGSATTWRLLMVQFDAMRARELPEPWPGVWVEHHESSMLVRNRTKVNLKVELYSPARVVVNPWNDWPLIARVLGPSAKKRMLVLAADIRPGIEWALRPRASEGRVFEMRLITDAGIVVCSKKLRRGQIFDFEVAVPRSACSSLGTARRRAFSSTSDCQGADNHDVVTAINKYDKSSVEDRNIDRLSICSTAAPPTVRSMTAMSNASEPAALEQEPCSSQWPSFGRSSANGFPEYFKMSETDAAGLAEDTEPLCAAAHSTDASKGFQPHPSMIHPPHREANQQGVAEIKRPVADFTQLEALKEAICPRCLHVMRARKTRPVAPAYKKGVSCDRCEMELMVGHASKLEDGKENFFHCGRCLFDLCHGCALREMCEVWWQEA